MEIDKTEVDALVEKFRAAKTINEADCINFHSVDDLIGALFELTRQQAKPDWRVSALENINALEKMSTSLVTQHESDTSYQTFKWPEIDWFELAKLDSATNTAPSITDDNFQRIIDTQTQRMLKKCAQDDIANHMAMVKDSQASADCFARVTNPGEYSWWRSSLSEIGAQLTASISKPLELESEKPTDLMAEVRRMCK